MKRSRAILALYVGALSLSVATLSMSVAWYATSTKLRIESINITIDCDHQLAISKNPDSGYHNTLKTEDFGEVGRFYPVTSAHDDWFIERKEKPEFYTDAVYTGIEQTEIKLMETGFLCTDLYLKSDENVIVSINPEESYIKPKEDFNKIYAEQIAINYPDLTVEEIIEQLNQLAHSIRFSILLLDEDNYQYVTIDPNKSMETHFGGLLDANDDDYYDYYTKSSDGLLYETFYGEINDPSYLRYDDPLNEDSDYEDVNEEPNAFNAKHKKGVKRINLEKSLLAGLEIKKEESHTLDEFASEDKPFEFAVYTSKPTHIVLSIYIEGWDLRSVNSTKGATFDSNLTFEIERKL